MTMTVMLDLLGLHLLGGSGELAPRFLASRWASARGVDLGTTRARRAAHRIDSLLLDAVGTVTDGELDVIGLDPVEPEHEQRTEEHTSELKSPMRISYALYCLNKKNNTVNY